MSTLYDRLLLLCGRMGISGYRMAKDNGISPSIMTDLKAGRKKGISADTADKLASYFGVSVGYLLGTEEQKEKPALPEEDELKLKVAAYWGGGEDLSKEELDELWEDAGSYFRFKMKEKQGPKGSGG